MRFMTRSLLGIVITAVTIGLLIMAAGRFFSALEERRARDAGPRIQKERVVAVKTDVFIRGPASPVMTAYGEIASWRSLELRAATAGTLTEISDVFRDGGAVKTGDLLFLIDPADAQSARDRAETELASAKAELSEARAAIANAQAELDAAIRQRELRSATRERQKSLRSRGVATDASVEAADLALSQAEQTVIGRQQARIQADARIELAEIQVRRQSLLLAEAERTLAETRFEAPFDGLLSNVNAVLGRLVSVNENLGTLIDPRALEVAFRVSNAQFARLIDGKGVLAPAKVTVGLTLENRMLEVVGTIDRAGTEVGTGQTGRLLYARLDPEGTSVLRPGDFVTVTINEPILQGVAEIPASAVSENGMTLVLDDDDRLLNVRVDVLRRQRNTAIVTGAPWGERFVITRAAHLGAGLKVKPVAVNPDAQATPVSDLVELDDDRRAKLTEFVEQNGRIPDEAKKRLLANLAKPKVPRAMIERLESRMGG